MNYKKYILLSMVFLIVFYFSINTLIWQMDWDFNKFTLWSIPLSILVGGITALVTKKILKLFEYKLYLKIFFTLHLIFFCFISIFTEIAYKLRISHRLFPSWWTSLYVTIPCIFYCIFILLKKKHFTKDL